jgi:hypothetical protein
LRVRALAVKRSHKGAILAVNPRGKSGINPSLGTPANGFDKGNPVNPRDVMFVGMVVETGHVKQGLLSHGGCSNGETGLLHVVVSGNVVDMVG